MEQPLHIVEINRKPYAIGLFWQAVGDISDQKDIQARGAELGYDLYVPRKNGIEQVGFAAIENGAKVGLYSLAAGVCKGAENRQIDGSWIAIFELPDGNYAYFTVIDNAVRPDGGDTVGSKDEVLHQLNRDRGMGYEWGHIIAPTSFEVPNALNFTLEEFLPKAGSWMSLRSTKPSLPWRKLILIMLLGAIGAGSFFGWNQYKLQKEEEELQALIAASNAASKAKSDMPAQRLAHPWATLPLPADYVYPCVNAVSATPRYPGGWAVEGMQCNYSAMTVSYKRGVSNLDALLNARSDVAFDVQGDKATAAIPLNVPMNGGDEAVLDDRSARVKFLTFFQRLGINVTLTELVIPPDPPSDDDVPAPIRDWRTFNFQVTSPLSPDLVLRYINMPGLRITKIEYKSAMSGEAARWLIDGSLYTNL